MKTAIALLCAGVILFACTDDQEQRSTHPGALCFNITKNNDWIEENATRAGAETPIALQGAIPGDTLYLHTDVTQGFPDDKLQSADTSATRANRYTDEVFNAAKINRFHVYAVEQPTALSAFGIMKKTFSISGMTQDANNYWVAQEDVYGKWGDNPADFYACAYEQLQQEFSGTDDTHGISFDYDNLSITYTAKTDVAIQQDLLTAQANNVRKDADIDLQFSHVLSAVKFWGTAYDNNDDLTWKDRETGETYSVKVKSVVLKDIRNTGEWQFSDREWHNVSGLQDYTVMLDENMQEGVLTPDDGGNVLMMVPQTLPSTARIEVTCVMTNTANASIEKEVAYYASIGGREWKAGYTYNYYLSLSDFDYTFTVTENGTNLDGGVYTDLPRNTTTKTIAVTSYRTDEKNNNGAVKWTASFQMEDDPEWYDGLPGWLDIDGMTEEAVHAGSKTPESMTMTVKAATDDDFDNQYKLGKDLSVWDFKQEKKWVTGRNTANCYIVSRPGKYKIPLVYGNAITANEDYPTAYLSGIDAEQVLYRFFNYNYTYVEGADKRGVPTAANYNASEFIQHPYIIDDCPGKVKDALLIWQDVRHDYGQSSYPDALVTNVTLDKTENENKHVKDKWYVCFDIKPESFRYGNAVVGITDGSTVMWSWHIWACNPDDFDTRETGTPLRIDVDGEIRDFKFAGANIGWVDGSQEQPATYRKAVVRLTQKESGKTCIFTVEQKVTESVQPEGSRGVLFQYGRKEPIHGLIETNDGTDGTPMRMGKRPGSSALNYKWDYPHTTANQEDLAYLGGADGIRNPTTTYMGSNVFMSGYAGGFYKEQFGNYLNAYKNRWGTYCQSARDHYYIYGKTVLDPSPVGYIVPPSGPLIVLNDNSNLLTKSMTYSYNTRYLTIGYGIWSMTVPLQGTRYLDINGFKQGNYNTEGFLLSSTRIRQNSSYNLKFYYSPSHLELLPLPHQVSEDYGIEMATGIFGGAVLGHTQQNRCCSVRPIAYEEQDVRKQDPFMLDDDTKAYPSESLSRGSRPILE